MKPLTCEMCASTEILKKDGLFECQICKTKYTIEEAKKMMTVEGVVKIDNTSNIENMLKLAENAYAAGNNTEALSYANKVLEGDGRNYLAWFIKAKVVGWQSTAANPKIDEAISAFSKAMDVAPQEKKEAIKTEAGNEFTKLSIAFINLCCGHYEKRPNYDNAKKVLTSFNTTINSGLKLLTQCGVKPDNLNENAADAIADAAFRASDAAVKKYNASAKESTMRGFSTRASKYVWEDLIQAGSAINLVNFATSISKNNDKNIVRYKKLLVLITELKFSRGGDSQIVYKPTADMVQMFDSNITNINAALKEIDPTYQVVSAAPKKKNFAVIAFFGVFAIGFLDIMIATGLFMENYRGLLSRFVGTIAYTSAYRAVGVWIALAVVAGIIAAVVSKTTAKPTNDDNNNQNNDLK